jgi:glycosyltransferase involved in cell wall biosynthesis
MIAYHFPPDAAVGALRPQKFVKYLPEFGWKPYVLTIKERFIEYRDDSRLNDVQGVEVIRTDFWRTPLQVYLDIRDRLRGGWTTEHATVTNSGPAVLGGRESLKSRLKRYVAACNWFPDDKLYWSIPAIWAGYRVIRREKISTIYATAPPHTVCLIGWALSLLSGARLIIDFRDPWRLFSGSMQNAKRCRLYDNLEKFCEKQVIRTAITVICTTERCAAALRDAYPEEAPAKFVTIPNGYDAADFAEKAGEATPNDTFIISYLGTFYLDRTPDTFLAALGRLIVDGEIPRNRVEVRFVGNVASACGASLSILLDKHGVSDCVKVMGQVPYREAMRCMQESDLLLLFAPNQPLQIPGKAFEYFGSRRPVLAFTEEGATADLVLDLNAGLVVCQDDMNGIVAALRKMYRSGDQSWYSAGDVAALARKQLTSRLADVLSSCSAHQT